MWTSVCAILESFSLYPDLGLYHVSKWVAYKVRACSHGGHITPGLTLCSYFGMMNCWIFVVLLKDWMETLLPPFVVKQHSHVPWLCPRVLWADTCSCWLGQEPPAARAWPRAGSCLWLSCVTCLISLLGFWYGWRVCYQSLGSEA